MPGQLIRQQREKRWVPHRDQPKVRPPDEMAERRVPEFVHGVRVPDRRGDGHHRPHEPLLKAANVFAVVREPHRYAGRRDLLRRLDGADGPVSRAVKQLGIVEEQIRDPGANAALKLVLEGSRIRNPLGRGRRPAGRFEQAHTLAGQHVRLSGGNAGDARAVVVVVAQRHARLIVARSADGRKPEPASERACLIPSQNATQHAFLFRANLAQGVSKAEIFGKAAREPGRIGEGGDHEARSPGVTSPMGVSSMRGVALRNAARKAR